MAVLFFILVGISNGASGVSHEALPLLAVSQLTSRSLAEGEAITLSDALGAAILKTGKYQVMERTQMKEVLNEQGFQKSGACDENSCVVEMGQLLGVDQMVIGSVGKIGKTYSISVRLVDVRTGKILRAETMNRKGEIDELLMKVIPELANRLTAAETNVGKVVVATAAPKKKKKNGLIIGAVTGAVVVVALTVTYFILSKKAESNRTSEIVLN